MSKQFDLAGAAQDYDQYLQRNAPIYAAPEMREAMGLLRRNPELAPAVRGFIESEMKKLPGGGVGLEASPYDRSA